jgi:hypothetical protein
MTFSIKGNATGSIFSTNATAQQDPDNEPGEFEDIINIAPLIGDVIDDNVTEDVREAAMGALRALQKESKKLKKTDPTVKLISVEDYNRVADLIETAESVSEINRALQELSKKYC